MVPACVVNDTGIVTLFWILIAVAGKLSTGGNTSPDGVMTEQVVVIVKP